MEKSLEELSEYVGKVRLTLWDKCETEIETFRFEKIESAIELVKKIADGSTPYHGAYGWSITDDDWYWIIEEGEKLIPIR